MKCVVCQDIHIMIALPDNVTTGLTFMQGYFAVRDSIIAMCFEILGVSCFPFKD